MEILQKNGLTIIGAFLLRCGQIYVDYRSNVFCVVCVLHSFVSYSIVLYSIVLHCIVLYCIVLHCMMVWVEGILLYSATTIAYQQNQRLSHPLPMWLQMVEEDNI